MSQAKNNRAWAPGVAGTVFGLCLLLSLPLAAQQNDPGTRLGKVRLDASKRRVTFPAIFNQIEGPLEYILVGNGGKTHESLLRTEVEPIQLHTAMLLLGVKTGERHPGDAPPSALNPDYLRTAPALKGDPVSILLRWTADGKEVICRAEELILNAETHATAAADEWTYNGSMFDEGHFLAQEEKSFVALVTDPAALVNNLRPGHEDDQRWSADKKKVPPKETPVEVTFEFKPVVTPAASPAPSNPLPVPNP